MAASFIASAAGPPNPAISLPTNIPDIDVKSSPVIEPGETGSIGLTIKNRYNESMFNVSATFEIYMSATYFEAVNASSVPNPPLTNASNLTHFEFFPIIYPNSTVAVSFDIFTQPGTTRGAYYVRMKLEFAYGVVNRTSCIMKSYGYFNRTAWDAATAIPPGIDRSNATQMAYYPGGINITMLGVDGILPDTSFSVEYDHNWWNFSNVNPYTIWAYVLIAATAFFGCLAAVFYWLDVKNASDKKLQRLLEEDEDEK